MDDAPPVASDFYVRYYVGHRGKFGHEFLEFELYPNGTQRPRVPSVQPR